VVGRIGHGAGTLRRRVGSDSGTGSYVRAMNAGGCGVPARYFAMPARNDFRPSAARLLLAPLLAAGLAACASAPTTPPAPAAAPVVWQPTAALRPFAAEWARLLALEDRRALGDAQLAEVMGTGAWAQPELRLIAVRALGRQEDPALVPRIAALLRDADPSVRAAAAHALGQALSRVQPGRDADADEALVATHRELAAALAADASPEAVAAIAETLGRLRHAGEADARTTLQRIVPHLAGTPAARLGALRGMHMLARQQPARGAFDAATVALLRQHAAPQPAAAPAEVAVRSRIVALQALATLTVADEATLLRALADADPGVRREAAAAAGTLTDVDAVRRLTQRALTDASPAVRYDALRVYGRRLAATDGCDPALAVLAAYQGPADGQADAGVHAELLAIDILGGACGTDPRAATRLAGIAATLPQDGAGGWHHAARALPPLAARSPGEARRLLPEFARHPSFFVRTYAARAAAELRDEATLRRLASDRHPNVRTAVVTGLRTVSGRAADDVYLAQLSQDDSQLLQAAAGALEGTTSPLAIGLLLRALDRISAEPRETSRDARRALLQRIAEVGTPPANPAPADAARIQQQVYRVGDYLSDFDPAIAALAAEVLGGWIGRAPPATPRPLEPLPLPTFEETATAAATAVTIEMADGGRFTLRLHAFDAPTNVARFLRLAAAGRFDGLTFHRVVPAFVVQGGSPSANEYAGDGPFTRDELGLGNWRGTIGLSTRGRDTGDGQIFINLIDNVRLDHDYTVFATVTSGMSTVDAMQEGAVIRRVIIGS
jgi:cyclophilin family peptidyl-prolyl cis-trans isomerase/HEAT repeat protein